MWEAVYFIPVVTIKYFWRSPDLLGFSMRSPLCSLKQKTHSLFLSMRHFLPSGVAHPYLFSWTTVSFFPRFILYLFTRVCVLGAWFFFRWPFLFFFIPVGLFRYFQVPCTFFPSSTASNCLWNYCSFLTRNQSFGLPSSHYFILLISLYLVRLMVLCLEIPWIFFLERNV